MRLTGERPIEGSTPDSLLALHAAGYREVRDRLGAGRVLDVGCGLGSSTVTLIGGDRVVVGVDYDPETASLARYASPALRTACTDGERLALRDGAVDWACSSHLIEHFVAPERHVAEVSRVLAPGGSAFFITPNAPADFENPFHVHLFEPRQLVDMLSRHFNDVEVLGLDGDPDVKADFERRRRTARRLLAIDVFGLRHRLPRSWFVAVHVTARRVAYRVMGNRWSGGATGIDDRSFSLTDRIDPSTLVLFAVAREPRR